MQNRMCGERSVEEVISSMSVDKAVSVPPLVSSPTPVFTVVQRKRRIVCLVLDVSGSMLVRTMFTFVIKDIQLTKNISD